MESIVPPGTDRQDDDELRAVLSPVLNEAMERGALTRREVSHVLNSLSTHDRWLAALDVLSERTRQKWQVQDELSGLRRAIEALCDEWFQIDRQYLDGGRPTNAVSAQAAAARLSQVVRGVS